MVSVQIEIAQWFPLVRRFLGLPQRFLKTLVEKLLLISLRLDGLTEDTLLALVLLMHRPGRGLEIFESAFAGRRSMRNDSPRFGVNLEQCAAIRAGYIEGVALFRAHTYRVF